MKTSIVILAGVFMLTSCAEEKKPEQKSNDLVQRNKKLVKHNMALYKTIDGIENKVLEYDEQLEFLIAKSGGDLAMLSVKDESQLDPMMKKIKWIEKAMDQSRYEIVELNKKEKLSTQEKALLNKKTKELGERMTFLQSIRDSLEYELVKGELLQKMMEEKRFFLEEELKAADEALNTVLFAFGTKEELLKQEVVTYHGGVLGLFQKAKLNDGLNEEYLSAADKRRLSLIPLRTTKAKLVTQHPADSYSFCEKDGIIECIRIENPDEFWKFGNKLAIVVQ